MAKAKPQKSKETENDIRKMAEEDTQKSEKIETEKRIEESSKIMERRIILIGNLGAGKSHSGNGILGDTVFESKRCFSLVTKKCKYASAVRNDLKYGVLDTPGINLADETEKNKFIMPDIKRNLFCLSPGFHAIVLVLSADERLTTDFLDLIKVSLGGHAFDYMIIVVSKYPNNENALNEIIMDSPELKDLKTRCKDRIVIFGDDPKRIPSDCLQTFDDTLTKLIDQNILLKNEYYTHMCSERAKTAIERDIADYLKKNPNIEREEAAAEVTSMAVQGRSKRDKEIVGKSCTIS